MWHRMRLVVCDKRFRVHTSPAPRPPPDNVRSRDDTATTAALISGCEDNCDLKIRSNIETLIAAWQSPDQHRNSMQSRTLRSTAREDSAVGRSSSAGHHATSDVRFLDGTRGRVHQHNAMVRRNQQAPAPHHPAGKRCVVERQVAAFSRAPADSSSPLFGEPAHPLRIHKQS